MDAFFKAMDETGVVESAVIGMPVVKKWDEGDEKRPTTTWITIPDILVQRDRFLVARAVLDLLRIKRPGCIPLSALQQRGSKRGDHVERMLALYPGFWQASARFSCGTTT